MNEYQKMDKNLVLLPFQSIIHFPLFNYNKDYDQSYSSLSPYLYKVRNE